LSLRRASRTGIDGRRVEENGARCFRGNNSQAKPEPYLGFEETLRLYLLNREAGVTFTTDTSRCQWHGESMDYSTAIEAMQFLEQKNGVAGPPISAS
jgi:hypothetical protein